MEFVTRAINAGQNASASLLLNPLKKLTDRFDESTWDRVTTFSFFFLICMEVAHSAEGVSVRYLFLYIPCSVLLALMVLGGLTRSVSPQKMYQPMVIAWYIIGISILINVFIVNTDDLSEALLWLVALPIFVFAWNCNDYQRLFSSMTKGVCLSFLPFFVVTLIWFPIDAAEFSSFLNNPNFAAMYLSCVILCGLMRLIAATRLIAIIGYGALIDCAIAFLYYSDSRGGVLACLACVIVLLSALFLQKKWKLALFRVVPVLLLSVCFVYGVLYLSHFIGVVLWNQQGEGMGGIDMFAERFEEKNESANGISTGRFSLWQSYIPEIRLWGHDGRERVINVATGALEKRSSHETHIEFAYRYGLLAGVSLLLVHLFSAVRSIRLTFMNQDKIYAIFPLITAVMYGFYSVYEANITTYGRPIILLFYLSLTPLFAAKGKKNVGR